mmetsp:Transcript_12975/g.43990  ORF Transcript_12975/g.43990 Transcript_12975/m.43990 type:complete len:229 (+) Transcript_12975:187-873(+)
MPAAVGRAARGGLRPGPLAGARMICGCDCATAQQPPAVRPRAAPTNKECKKRQRLGRSARTTPGRHQPRLDPHDLLLPREEPLAVVLAHGHMPQHVAAHEREDEEDGYHRGRVAEAVQVGQVAQVEQVLLHGELGLAVLPVSEGDGHLDHLGGPAAHHELQADLVAHGIQLGLDRALKRLARDAEEAAHGVRARGQRPREEGGPHADDPPREWPVLGHRAARDVPRAD